jgi:DNA-binding transcriptional LysR family regulator
MVRHLSVLVAQVDFVEGLKMSPSNKKMSLCFVAEVDSHELIKRMVAVGVGYALMAEPAVQHEIESGLISGSVVVQPDLSVPFYLVHSTQKNADLATRELSRFITQVAEETSQRGIWH